MLVDVFIVQVVVCNLKQYDFGFLIVDLVMIVKGGVKLLVDEVIIIVKEEFLLLVILVIFNLLEVEVLIGLKVECFVDMVKIGQVL